MEQLELSYFLLRYPLREIKFIPSLHDSWLWETWKTKLKPVLVLVGLRQFSAQKVAGAIIWLKSKREDDSFLFLSKKNKK